MSSVEESYRRQMDELDARFNNIVETLEEYDELIGLATEMAVDQYLQGAEPDETAEAAVLEAEELRRRIRHARALMVYRQKVHKRRSLALLGLYRQRATLHRIIARQARFVALLAEQQAESTPNENNAEPNQQ